MERKLKGDREDLQAGGGFPARKQSDDHVVQHAVKQCLLSQAAPEPPLQPGPAVLPRHHSSMLCHQLRWMTGMSHHPGFLLCINHIISFQSLGRQESLAGWADSIQCFAIHIIALVKLVAGNAKPTFALMLSQPAQSLLTLVMLFLAHAPVGVSQQCQHIHMEALHFSLPTTPTLCFLVLGSNL